MDNRTQRAAISIRRVLYATTILAVAMAFARVTYSDWMSAPPLFTFVTGGLIGAAIGTLVGGRQSFISWGSIGAFGGFLVPPAYLLACELPAFVMIYVRHFRVMAVIILFYSAPLLLIVSFHYIRRLLVSRRGNSQQ